jgi:hypothetical protein
MRTDIAPFRKREFEIAIQIDDLDTARANEFVAAIYRDKPSRLDNIIEIEIMHRPDQHVHVTVQMICDRGVRALTLRTVYPEPSPIRADPLTTYMKFEYEDGKVIDQWTEMNRRDGDEPMVDVLKISFTKKMVTDAVWVSDECSVSPAPDATLAEAR